MIVQLLGRLMAALPLRVVEGLCAGAGTVLSVLPRGRMVRRNMQMALGLDEEIDKKKLEKMAREACCRTIELGVMGLAGQYFSPERWRQTIGVSDETQKLVEELLAQPRGVLLLIPHTTLMEALTALPIFFNPSKSVSVLYRSFASPAVEEAILGRRQAHGVRLLSRQKGMRELIQGLRAGNVGGLLFDQSSGEKGTLISFMGRAAAASNLPDIILQHASPIPVVLAIRRTGFWRGQLVVQKLEEADNAPALTLQSHRWLEGYLRDERSSTDWLWLHNRWKCLNAPWERLGFSGRFGRTVLEVAKEKKTKIFIRMPNWLGDIVMALPVLRALRASRPDAQITLFCRSPYIPLIEKFAIADRVLGLPKKLWKSVGYLRTFKNERPDFCLALTNSLRGDLEMWATGSKQRAGLTREGYWRPLVNCGLRICKKQLAESHQSHVWERLFEACGLTVPVSYAPFSFGKNNNESRNEVNKEFKTGIVAGSANTPEKRYPAAQWRQLVEKINKPIVLFGAPAEAEITKEIAQGLHNVTDLAGKTDLATLADEIAKCSFVIGNDTGAIHLANALGVPTLVIYGPTSPTRTRPIFTAPYYQLKAPAGQPIGSVSVEEIVKKLQEITVI